MWVIILSILLVIFNIFDAIITLYFVNNKLAIEVNPICLFLIDNNWFIPYKIIVPILVCILVYIKSQIKWVRIIFIFTLLVYSALTLYHLYHLWGGSVWPAIKYQT